METLQAVIDKIIFHNEENGFTVIRCRRDEEDDDGQLFSAVGVTANIRTGATVSLTGEWKVNARFGKQFSFDSYEEVLPVTTEGIEKYLSSKLVEGIGTKFAKRIVKQFGEKTLEVIENTPEELAKVPGLGKGRIQKITSSWEKHNGIRKVMLFLQSHHISTSQATKIYNTYGHNSIRAVTENPYQLADSIWGIGFKTADQIAENLGFDKEKYVRLRSGLLYTLNRMAEEGHCYAPRAVLLQKGQELLSVEQPLLEATLNQMIQEEDVVEDKSEAGQDGIYLSEYYEAEVSVARRLKEILQAGGLVVPTEGLAQQLTTGEDVPYDPVQIQAILQAVQSKILILTGGPGTGKTTTTQGIIKAFQKSRAKVLLAAPTGRAAKRLSEATKLEAKTIHRLLEYKPIEGYLHNEASPLLGDVLIVDECSMIDILLMDNLLKAVPDIMTLILVGDVDQLPSVGAGNVLRDLIASGAFPVVRLTKIFRQAQTSRIIMNAHRINEGQVPDLSNGKNSDFFFEEKTTPEEAVESIVELVKNRLPGYYHVQPSEIQVLTPMQRGEAGVINLNQVLQQALNPGGSYIQHGAVQFRLNDKVMQIRNNYDKDVFNGDIGQIVKVEEETKELVVLFDRQSVPYEVEELDELVLAYATTIHKAQGSEYPIVVMPVLMSHYVMLQRNLLYTGVTRAKKCMVMVGDRKAVHAAVQNTSVVRRYTMLASRIQEEERRKQ